MKITTKELNTLKNDLESITLEKVGTWIWASGDKKLFTDMVRKILKSKGFRFSRKKLAWYYFQGIKTSPKRRTSKFDNLKSVKEIWECEELPPNILIS